MPIASRKFSISLVCSLALLSAATAQWTTLTGSVGRYGAAHWSPPGANGMYIYSGTFVK
jgi:hypothetical protein